MHRHGTWEVEVSYQMVELVALLSIIPFWLQHRLWGFNYKYLLGLHPDLPWTATWFQTLDIYLLLPVSTLSRVKTSDEIAFTHFVPKEILHANHWYYLCPTSLTKSASALSAVKLSQGMASFVSTTISQPSCQPSFPSSHLHFFTWMYATYISRCAIANPWCFHGGGTARTWPWYRSNAAEPNGVVDAADSRLLSCLNVVASTPGRWSPPSIDGAI